MSRANPLSLFPLYPSPSPSADISQPLLVYKGDTIGNGRNLFQRALYKAEALINTSCIFPPEFKSLFFRNPSYFSPSFFSPPFHSHSGGIDFQLINLTSLRDRANAFNAHPPNAIFNGPLIREYIN